MYDLTDLKGLMTPELYNKLNEDDNGTKNYDKIKDEVETMVTHYTNYSNTELSDTAFSQIKDQLRRPFAWITEYFALKFIKALPEESREIIIKNYQDAKYMLQTFERYYKDEQGDEDSSSVFDIDGVVGW